MKNSYWLGQGIWDSPCRHESAGRTEPPDPGSIPGPATGENNKQNRPHCGRFCYTIVVKNCIIIHGGPLTDTPIEPHNLHTLYWHPWTKQKLEKGGISTVVPPMPNPWNPIYEEWKEEFEKLPVTEESVLIGHSRGVAFLLRWLSETKKSAHQLVLVAPNLQTESLDPVLQKFYDFEIDLAISERVTDIVVFTSENDDVENMESAKLLVSTLNCRLVNLPTHGHFITEEMGGNEFPELVAEVVN